MEEEKALCVIWNVSELNTTHIHSLFGDKGVSKAHAEITYRQILTWYEAVSFLHSPETQLVPCGVLSLCLEISTR